MPKEDIKSQFEAVKKALDRSGAYQLNTEVVVFALKAMKENPKLTLAEAMESGCGEWDV